MQTLQQLPFQPGANGLVKLPCTERRGVLSTLSPLATFSLIKCGYGGVRDLIFDKEVG